MICDMYMHVVRNGLPLQERVRNKVGPAQSQFLRLYVRMWFSPDALHWATARIYAISTKPHYVCKSTIFCRVPAIFLDLNHAISPHVHLTTSMWCAQDFCLHHRMGGPTETSDRQYTGSVVLVSFLQPGRIGWQLSANFLGFHDTIMPACTC